MIVSRNLSLQSVTASVRRENLVYFLLSLVVTFVFNWLELHYNWPKLNEWALPITPFTILGGGITIFLGFRTTTAYGRWWEARTLWGGIVNQSRTLVRQAITFSGKKGEILPFARDIAYRQIALVNAIRCHLRQSDPIEAIQAYLPAEEIESLRSHQNIPVAILQNMGGLVQSAYRDGLMDSIQMTSMDSTLADLTDLLGGCERIKNTPLPRQYDVVPQLTISLYSVLLPFGLVSTLHWWTPIISGLITFLFIAIDSIGSNIEDPFENTIHDTPMTALCRTIEINILQMIGAKDIPEPIRPMRGVIH